MTDNRKYRIKVEHYMKSFTRFLILIGLVTNTTFTSCTNKKYEYNLTYSTAYNYIFKFNISNVGKKYITFKNF